jgi:hypothetical protein
MSHPLHDHINHISVTLTQGHLQYVHFRALHEINQNDFDWSYSYYLERLKKWDSTDESLGMLELPFRLESQKEYILAEEPIRLDFQQFQNLESILSTYNEQSEDVYELRQVIGELNATTQLLEKENIRLKEGLNRLKLEMETSTHRRQQVCDMFKAENPSSLSQRLMDYIELNRWVKEDEDNSSYSIVYLDQMETELWKSCHLLQEDGQ